MLVLMLGLTNEERRIQKVDVTEGIGNKTITPIINKNRHINSHKYFFEIFEQSKTGNFTQYARIASTRSTTCK